MMTCRDYRTNFDHLDPEFEANATAITADLRRACPITHTPEHEGYWVASRYADILHVLRDDDVFVCRGGTTIPPDPEAEPALPFEVDGAEHQRFRRVLQKFFVPNAIHRHEARLRELAKASIAESCDRASLRKHFAPQFTAGVIALMLGLRQRRWPKFCRLLQSIVVSNQALATTTKARLSLMRMMLRELEERRIEPSDDLFGALVSQDQQGAALSDDEALNLVTSLLVAAMDPTVKALHAAVDYLTQERVAALRVDRSHIPAFVEEVLRCSSPVRYVARNLTVDRSFYDKTISAQQRLFLLLGSANQDEMQFEDAEGFHMRRSPNRHLAFGHGVHFCLGAQLARTMLYVAIEAMLSDESLDWEEP